MARISLIYLFHGSVITCVFCSRLYLRYIYTYFKRTQRADVVYRMLMFGIPAAIRHAGTTAGRWLLLETHSGIVDL